MRTPYVRPDAPKTWNGVRFRRIWAPKMKGHEAAVHSLLAVLYAAVRRPDVVHVHAIGSAMWVPLARALGLKVVVTHHSLNYEHEKWGATARAMLRFGEFAGMRYSNGRIAIARPIAELMPERHGVTMTFVPNGVGMPTIDDALGSARRPRARARQVPALRRTPHAREAPARPRAGVRLRRRCRAGSWPSSAPPTPPASTPARCSSWPAHARRRVHRLPVGRDAAAALPARRRLRTRLVARGPVDRDARSPQLRPARRRQRHPRQPGRRARAVQLLPGRRRGRRSPSASEAVTAPRRPRPRSGDARRAFVAKHYSWSEAAADTLVVYREAIGQPALRLVHSSAGEPSDG